MCVVVTAYGICYEDILPSLSEQDIFQTVALNSLGKGNNAVWEKWVSGFFGSIRPTKHISQLAFETDFGHMVEFICLNFSKQLYIYFFFNIIEYYNNKLCMCCFIPYETKLELGKNIFKFIFATLFLFWLAG